MKHLVSVLSLSLLNLVITVTVTTKISPEITPREEGEIMACRKSVVPLTVLHFYHKSASKEEKRTLGTGKSFSFTAAYYVKRSISRTRIGVVLFPQLCCFRVFSSFLHWCFPVWIRVGLRPNFFADAWAWRFIFVFFLCGISWLRKRKNKGANYFRTLLIIEKGMKYENAYLWLFLILACLQEK